ncbi:MAG: flavodoxin domain-containing protein [Anaerolineae bacterium]
MRILVTYATKHGATAEIASTIGEVLKEHDLSVDVLRIKQVDDLSLYSAVIVGSSIYFGDWRHEMVNFLKDNEKHLVKRDVWIFSSGPTGTKDDYELLAEWRFPLWLRPLLERIQPHEAAVFYGNLDREKLNFLEKQLVRLNNTPFGDFRDWVEIKAWATTIANQLE